MLYNFVRFCICTAFLAVIRVRFQNEFPAKFALADWGGLFKMKNVFRWSDRAGERGEKVNLREVINIFLAFIPFLCFRSFELFQC